MKFKLITIQNPEGAEVHRYKDAEHDCWQGVHTIKQGNNVFWWPLTFTILCYEPAVVLSEKAKALKEEAEKYGWPFKDLPMVSMPNPEDLLGELQLDQLSGVSQLIDAGNELLRLVVETRDSIFESNTIQSTGEFPNDEDGKQGKAWYEEYAKAAAKWLDLQGENKHDTNSDRIEDKD